VVKSRSGTSYQQARWDIIQSTLVLPAAVAFHRVGIETTVYERAEELREVGAGMMLWPNAMRVLKDLGVLARVTAASGPNQHFLVRASCTGRFDVPAFCTRRSDLLDALISSLLVGQVRLGRCFEAFERRKRGAQRRTSASILR
jgi:2-polyprenyl-6-methoxyphenol hydroxylase-like FAD-dependent oxidoreductase